MLADVRGNNFTVLRVRVSKDVLDEIVSILVAGDINEWDARTVVTACTDTVEIAGQEIDSTNLQTFLHDLGCELISAVLRSIANDMVNGTATISRGTVFANVLDAPVAELTMGDDVNAGQNLLDTWALVSIN